MYYRNIGHGLECICYPTFVSVEDADGENSVELRFDSLSALLRAIAEDRPTYRPPQAVLDAWAKAPPDVDRGDVDRPKETT